MRIYLKVKGRLFITASSKAGWSQQAVDPVGDSTPEDEVSLHDPTLSIINEDFSLFKEETTGSTSAPSSFCLQFLSVSVVLTMSFVPPQMNESGEPCRVRTESR